MNREPIALYIFRFVLGFGLFAFMCLLYWSSVLIEENIKEIRSDIAEIREDLVELQSDTDRVRDDVMRAILYAQPQESLPQQNSSLSSNRTRIDQNLPNMLQEDPFYAVTLPKMLGPQFRPRGTLNGAVVGKPENLHPFSNWSSVSGWRNQCSVTLARLEFGKYETMAPYMAIKIEERPREGSDLPEYWVHLRDNVFWQPLHEGMYAEEMILASHFKSKHQVTAADFKFYFDALMNPSVEVAGAVSLRNYLGDIEEIEVIDKLTFIVRWKGIPVTQPDGSVVEKVKYSAKQLTGDLRPLASFVYKYFADGTKIVEDDTDRETYRKNSVWAQNFNHHWAKNMIVSCGPWIFDGMSDRQIRFRRNPDHFFPLDVLVESQEVQFKNSPDSIWQDFKSGKLDTYSVRPDQLMELKDFLKSDVYQTQKQHNSAIDRLDYLARSYAYIGWNQNTPYFKSDKVRQAMTMAIDRQRIVQQILNGLGVEITGPFFRNSPSYDQTITPWPFDMHAAKRLLEEDGWFDSNGDGILDKVVNGKRIPFEFGLTYYVKNQTTKAICEYIATALREIGVLCRLNGVDIADLSASFDDKSFDALYLGWALGAPPEDPRQLWHSMWAKEKGSSNAVGFSNPEADQIIDRLQFEADQEKRLELYHRFHEILHEDQPYTFLYSPKTAFIFRDYVQNVFIPAERQDLVPGANIAEPISSVFWLKK